MRIDAGTRVSDIAVANPATIKVFQRHGIDFCCGGKVPLAEVCEQRGVDPNVVLRDLRAARPAGGDPTDWAHRTLAELARHIQERYHEPLRLELPRLGALAARVVERHGERLPHTLLSLRDVLEAMRNELIDHMAREDAVLFPLIVQMETRGGKAEPAWTARIRQIVHRMCREHDAVGAALAKMRELTNGYMAPTWACPTLLGLYHGLAELERDMQVHVHLENAILFARATGDNVPGTS
jgi:regulator of cell morphogenesis and NO signaling